MILYPTETIYGLGVNVFDSDARRSLFSLKGRDEGQTASWLVRDINDIKKYAQVSTETIKIVERFLPGSLTLVLAAKDSVPEKCQAEDGTIGFRISSDPVAQKLIAEYMNEHNAPLTCTSANVSGLQPESTPEKIIEQFKTADRDINTIDRIVDDGPRSGLPSTIVRVIDGQVEILREGSIPTDDIMIH